MPFLSISRRTRKSPSKPIQENIVPPLIAEAIAISEIENNQNVPEVVSEKILIGLPDSSDTDSENISQTEIPEEVIKAPEPEILNEKISEPETESKTEPEEPEIEISSEPETLQETESKNETQTEIIQPEEPEQKPEPKSEEFKLKYDFTSGERYVDSISTKTEFDKMLDELENMSKDFLSWEAEKFMKKFMDKFKSDSNNTEEHAKAKKFEAFLGGFIKEAAMILYDKGYGDLAIKRLEQAKSILETKKRLEEETLAINTRVEESGDMVDLSDILSLLGDG